MWRCCGAGLMLWEGSGQEGIRLSQRRIDCVASDRLKISSHLSLGTGGGGVFIRGCKRGGFKLTDEALDQSGDISLLAEAYKNKRELLNPLAKPITLKSASATLKFTQAQGAGLLQLRPA